MKKCKYHCDYGDGENCHYEGKDDCVYNKKNEIKDRFPSVKDIRYCSKCGAQLDYRDFYCAKCGKSFYLT